MWLLAEPRPDVPRLERADWICLAVLGVLGLLFLAPGLAHPHIHNWDEAFHQAATRGTYDTFFAPHLYRIQVYEAPLRHWWLSGIWLHKPTGAFWLGALMMHVVGSEPLALRMVSLISELVAAGCVFLLARPLVGRIPSFLATASFLLLPFGWIVVQGHFVGDATDATVTVFVALSVLLMLYGIERQHWKWFALAGVALGWGYLCKSFLALTPLGVIGVLWLTGRLGWTKAFKLKWAALYFGAAVAMAAPWNVYAALKWPEVWKRAFLHTIGFLSPESGEDVGSGARPRDAIFNEINQIVLEPIPQAFALLAGVWLLVVAIRRKDFWSGGVALWLWASWVVHSLANVKGHGHLWNVVPAWFVASALVMRDVWRVRELAAASAVAMTLPLWLERFPGLASIRGVVPGWFVQTRSVPGLAEGVVLMAAAAGLAALTRLVPKVPKGAVVGGLAAAASVAFVWSHGVRAYQQKHFREAERPWRLASYSKEAGQAVAKVLPKDSLIFLDIDVEAFSGFEQLSMMVWSGHMTYLHAPEPDRAHRHGLHPYLMSPAAEPFTSIPVPAGAWMRIYDLDAPAAPPAPPPDMTPLSATEGSLTLLGVGTAEIDGSHDRWAFYIRPEGIPSGVLMTLELADGTKFSQQIEPEASLRARHRLAGTAWFVMPMVGPRRSQVKSVQLGTSAPVALPPAPSRG